MRVFGCDDKSRRSVSHSGSRDPRENGFLARYGESRNGEEVSAHNTAGDSAENTTDRVAGQPNVQRAAKRDLWTQAGETIAEIVSADWTRGKLISLFPWCNLHVMRELHGTDRSVSNIIDRIVYRILIVRQVNFTDKNVKENAKWRDSKLKS